MKRATSILRSRAPVRIDLAGGWTDVPPFSAEVGGAVVNAAINRYTYATLVPRADERVRITSADFELTIEAESTRDLIYNGNLDLVKAAIRRLGIEQGMDIYVRCEAPPGSGSGTSASLGVALLGLLNRLQPDRLARHELAELAHLLETEELHISGGKQDQYAAAVGGISFMEFHDPTVSVSQLHLSPAATNDLEKHLVMCYTGKSRVSGDLIDAVMGAYRRGVPETTQALHRLKGIAFDMKSALLKGDLVAFGKLLEENWECQKKLDGSITTPQIDALFELAYNAGAIGGKALGAGGGGCLLFYCAADREHLVCKALAEAGAQVIDFNFDFKGLQVWSSVSD